jgi:hypothetical protein
MTDGPSWESGGQRRPIPDPTERTLEQSRREIAQLKELLEDRIQAERDLSAQRYSLAREVLDTRLADHAVLTTERFDSIRRETQLALTAAQAAVDKAEQSTTKTLDALQLNIAEQFASVAAARESQVMALEAQITSLKERQDREQGKDTGQSQSWLFFVGVATLMLGLAALAVAVVTAINAIP